MSIRTDVSSARRSTILKAVASLGIVASAAAVTGLGTFGSFTDSTTPVDTTVDTGVVSINLGPAAHYRTYPMPVLGFMPGDSSATPFDVVNDGDVDWESVTVKAWASTSSLLDTDTEHGLQLTLESCATSWTAAADGYACAGGAQELYSGPVVTDEPLVGARSLTPGGVDHVLATIDFPATAGNAYKNLRTDLAFTFTAVQRDGSAR